MVTSDRYRFPTVDCDDFARDAMKKTEQSMRDEVGNYVRHLLRIHRQAYASSPSLYI